MDELAAEFSITIITFYKAEDGALVNRFNAVIFDLDGTLADTFPLVVGAFNYAVKSRLDREYTLDELKKYFGPPEIEILRRLFPSPADHESAIDSFHQFNNERKELIKRVPGMRELLSKLKDRGIHRAVYTGAGHRAGSDRVNHLGLSDLFEVVLGGDEVSNYKPHPEGINQILADWDVNADRAAFVGDSVVDVEAGHAAAVTAVAVTWGIASIDKLIAVSPDYICHAVGELEEVLLQEIK
ncbi:MAG TPA: HAD family hydrolase [Blastocatellia bacterium]|nr:HAD family hydrolase [Blastocatellia bacterium]